MISSTCSRHSAAAVEVRTLSSRSRPPSSVCAWLCVPVNRPNQTSMSRTTKRDAFFQQVPPVCLSSDHIVCVCVCVYTLLSVEFPCVCQLSVTHENSSLSLRDYSHIPKNQARTQNSACSDGTLAPVGRLRASVYTG